MSVKDVLDDILRNVERNLNSGKNISSMVVRTPKVSNKRTIEEVERSLHVGLLPAGHGIRKQKKQREPDLIQEFLSGKSKETEAMIERLAVEQKANRRVIEIDPKKIPVAPIKETVEQFNKRMLEEGAKLLKKRTRKEKSLKKFNAQMKTLEEKEKADEAPYIRVNSQIEAERKIINDAILEANAKRALTDAQVEAMIADPEKAEKNRINIEKQMKYVKDVVEKNKLSQQIKMKALEELEQHNRAKELGNIHVENQRLNAGELEKTIHFAIKDYEAYASGHYTFLKHYPWRRDAFTVSLAKEKKEAETQKKEQLRIIMEWIKNPTRIIINPDESHIQRDLMGTRGLPYIGRVYELIEALTRQLQHGTKFPKGDEHRMLLQHFANETNSLEGLYKLKEKVAGLFKENAHKVGINSSDTYIENFNEALKLYNEDVERNMQNKVSMGLPDQEFMDDPMFRSIRFKNAKDKYDRDQAEMKDKEQQRINNEAMEKKIEEALRNEVTMVIPSSLDNKKRREGSKLINAKMRLASSEQSMGEGWETVILKYHDGTPVLDLNKQVQYTEKPVILTKKLLEQDKNRLEQSAYLDAKTAEMKVFKKDILHGEKTRIEPSIPEKKGKATKKVVFKKVIGRNYGPVEERIKTADELKVEKEFGGVIW